MKTTSDNNRLIAEFMGLHSMTMREWENYEGEGRDDIYWSDYHDNYDSSWNKLMPVVEKIEEIPNYEDEIMKEHAFYVDTCFNHCQIGKMDGSYDIICDEEDASKLDATYRAIVKFIEWYNNQNK